MSKVHVYIQEKIIKIGVLQTRYNTDWLFKRVINMSSAVIDQRILKFISFCHATFKNSKEVAFGVDHAQSLLTWLLDTEDELSEPLRVVAVADDTYLVGEASSMARR